MYNVTKKCLIHNFWVVMRISFLTMVALMTMTGLLLANDGVSQSLDDYEVNLKFKNALLKDVFEEIEASTDFTFSFASPIGEMSIAELDVSNGNLGEVLENLTDRLGLDFNLIDGMVAVYNVPDANNSDLRNLRTNTNLKSNEQEKIEKRVREIGVQKLISTFRNWVLVDTLKGVVLDEANEPLIGASVSVKGTTSGTTTDFDGGFSIINVEDNATLVISYVGYEAQEVEVGGRSDITVILTTDSELLEEVVVVGYGTQKKINMTGAVSEINSDEIEMRSVNTATQALQGLAPNLNVDVNATGGAADAEMNINIRGTGSLSNSSPYILINGVRSSPSELSALNANDIESISVLKDAASTAIYGAQAAFGVILVETKKGGNNQDFSISYSNSFRSKKRIFVPDFVNSITYADVLNTASQNFSGQVAIGADQMEKIRQFSTGQISYQTEADPNNPNQWLGIQSGTSNGWYTGFAESNWWDIIFKDKEFAHKHDISASGGSESISYHLAGSFFEDEGALDYGDENESFKRYNIDGFITAQITDWLSVSNNTRFYQENNSFPATLEGGSRGRLYHDAMRFSPLAPYKTPQVLDDEGNVLVEEQLALLPGWLENNGFNAYNENNFVTSFRSELTLTKDFSIKGDYSFKKIFYDRTLNYKKWSLTGPDGRPSITYQANNNQITKDIRKTDYQSFNIYADYSKNFLNDHNINVLLGYQQEENDYFQVVASKRDVIADQLNSLDIAIGDVIGPNNPIDTWSTLGYFGRFSYNYKEKYLFEFNGRYDGSSKFEDGDRFGFFPSASVGYNVHRENFWESSLGSFMDQLKVRLSYGKLGNQNVSSYLYLSNIPISNRLGWIVDGTRPNYAGIPGIVSPDITWETSVTKNLGLDLAFLGSRLTTTFDIYERQTDNMFGPSGALPAVLGTSPPQTNSASLKTNGWELTLGWRDGIGDFNYNVNVLLSDNRSVITEYHNPNKVISDWYVGKEIGEIWGFEAEDLFQTTGEVEDYLTNVDLSYFGSGWQPGDVKYLDVNGDGAVNIGDNTVNNPGDRKIIGNSQPRYRYSINGGIAWKGFTLDVLFQGVGKKDYMPSSYATLFWGWNSRGHSNVTEAVLDFWSEDNPNGYLPLPLEAGGRNGFGKDRATSTRYLQNAAYLRLKNLSLGYTIPGRLLTSVPAVKGLRLYASGENLMTFTNLWENFDPEISDVTGSGRIGDSRAYPLARTISFGLRVQF